MHLFQNKKKDVKQFLQEMKANKTHKSSNNNSIERKKDKSMVQKIQIDDDHYDSNGFANKINYNSQNLAASRSISNTDSNRTIRGSNIPNQINPYQKNIYNQGYQRLSQEQHNYMNQNQSQGFYQGSIQGRDYYPAQQQINQGYQTYHKNYRSTQMYQSPIQFQQSPRQFQQSPRQIQQSQRQFNQNNFYREPNYQMTESLHSQRTNNKKDNRDLDINYQKNISQSSNSTIYQEPQYYKNLNFSNQNRTNTVFTSSHDINKSSNYEHNFRSKNIENNQYKTYQSENIGKIKSQQYENQPNNYRMINSFSQISNIDLSMEEIRQAEPGLSTQKNSPVKFTDLYSKLKNTKKLQSKKGQIKNLFESEVIEIDELNLRIGNKNVKQSKTTQLQSKIQEKSIFNKLFEIDQSNCVVKNYNNEKNLNLQFQTTQQIIRNKRVQKLEVNHNWNQNPEISLQIEPQKKEKELPSFKVTQGQKQRLKNSMHTIFYVTQNLRLIHSQIQILFTNIERGRKDFDFEWNNSEGRFFKYLNGGKQWNNFSALQIQQEKKLNKITKPIKLDLIQENKQIANVNQQKPRQLKVEVTIKKKGKPGRPRRIRPQNQAQTIKKQAHRLQQHLQIQI